MKGLLICTTIIVLVEFCCLRQGPHTREKTHKLARGSVFFSPAKLLSSENYLCWRALLDTHSPCQKFWVAPQQQRKGTWGAVNCSTQHETLIHVAVRPCGTRSREQQTHHQKQNSLSEWARQPHCWRSCCRSLCQSGHMCIPPSTGECVPRRVPASSACTAGAGVCGLSRYGASERHWGRCRDQEAQKTCRGAKGLGTCTGQSAGKGQRGARCVRYRAVGG